MQAVPLMQREMRRHFVMNCCLVATAVVGGVAVTNERGVFSPLGFNPFSAYAQAFASLANPVTGLRHIRNVPAATPLAGIGGPGAVRGPQRTLAALPEAPAEEFGGVPPEPFDLGPLAPQEIADAGGLPDSAFPGFIPGSTGFPGGGLTVPDDLIQQQDTPPVTPVPEPAAWALLIAGFGLMGGVMRVVAARRRRADLIA